MPALAFIILARSLPLERTRLLVVENAVDAAFLVTEACGGTGRAAAPATALAALDRAARLAVVVLAVDSFDAVAAFGAINCCVVQWRRGKDVTTKLLVNVHAVSDDIAVCVVS